MRSCCLGAYLKWNKDFIGRYAKSVFTQKRFIEECPFYKAIVTETIEHMLLEVSREQALRADILPQ
ncbi:hypothetical protein BB561_004207 [Smittium simulii]|uniref:Uncharacterized protein n=1 Tax=Smittium simulii TaxID=133385 RepID=A0A2T9YHJ1_9FUNG|nr:hypothetical protein BB561_004207 [Smittium simulii]